MAQVFSLRLFERITALFARVLHPLGPSSEAGGRDGANAAPLAPRDERPGVFRAPTEKLATGATVLPQREPDEPPEPDAVGAKTEAEAMPTAALGSDPCRDAEPSAPEPAAASGGKSLSTDEQAAFRAIAALLGSGKSEMSPSRALPDFGDEAPGDNRPAAREPGTESRAIFDLVPLGIVVLRGLEPIFVNRFLLELLATTGLSDALEARRLDGIVRQIARVTRGGEVVEVESGGARLAMIASVHRVTWDGDAATLACLRSSAETGWKQKEEELRDARRRAERASALKSDFLAKVSHEIRTPLNAILGFAEVILDERFGPIGNARYKDYLQDIHASGAHVMSLVNDLLDLSKIEAGKMELAFAPVDANKIVAECVSIMQPQAIRERVVLRLSLAPGLPPLLADERSLRQIVLNLVSNAVKFNEPGGQVVVATAQGDSGRALIRVEDTGIGMSDAEIGIALEPFGRVTNARPSVGTGLGLPLTKALVEANRAHLSITSKKSEGTSIEIAFPPA